MSAGRLRNRQILFGVHDLSETECLDFFPVLRQSTVWILEEDKKKKEELAQQKKLEDAIAKFSAPAETPKSLATPGQSARRDNKA